MPVNKLLRCIIFLIALTLPAAVLADIYVYVDEHGVSHYTNVPTSSRYKPIRLGRLNTPSPAGSRAGNIRSRGYKTTITKNPADFDHHIRQAALSQMVDPLLIKAIIKTESNFDQNAVSTSGAVGLMQLMPETARDMRVGNPFDPAQNIYGGTRYFRNLLNSYDGDLALSLAAYNAGPGRVAKNGPLPKIPETREYVRRVIQLYRSYQQSTSTAVSMSKNINVRKLVTVN